MMEGPQRHSKAIVHVMIIIIVAIIIFIISLNLLILCMLCVKFQSNVSLISKYCQRTLTMKVYSCSVKDGISHQKLFELKNITLVK